MADTTFHPDPQTPVACTQESSDIRRGETLSMWRNPRNESNTIEAQQTGLRSYPQISIHGLCNSIRCTAKDPVLHSPGGVCVLGDVSGRIDRPDRTHCDEKQQKAEKTTPRNFQPVCFCSRICTALFERAHGQS